jgi:uncharacterized membrane protein
MSADIESRLAVIERRLARLEARAGGTTEQEKQQASVGTPVSTTVQPPKTYEQAQQIRRAYPSEPLNWPVTKILGWGGATALVLAAAYLIRLAIIDGWLTPTRQVAFAILTGIALIATGIKLKDADREYASLLPAGGIVILFLSIYGAHLYYDLISVTVASVAVMMVCGGSLVLCREFSSQLYAFFAVIGSYSAPFLLGGYAADITDLVIYYSCWSVIFSVFSVWLGNRGVYLLALYMALVGFDVLWKLGASDAWVAVVVFQFLQLIIFAVCAVFYAARHDEPMTQEVAMAHAPALLIFYALEYAVLDKHLPGLAPWVAVISAGVLLLAYQVARRYLEGSLDGSKWLLAAYCALVLLHAGYLESVPDGWGPWVALLLIAMAGTYLFRRREPGLLNGPIGWVIGVIFAGNYVRLVSGFEAGNVPASDFLLILYAVQLYTGYYFIRKEAGLSRYAPLMVYGGHIAAMTAALYVLDSRFTVSITWGVLALGCLLLALRVKDKSLGQSSLLIFGVSAIKVFALDLAGATPAIRIACLAALGVSLYLGGWLYRKIEVLEPSNEAT